VNWLGWRRRAEVLPTSCDREDATRHIAGGVRRVAARLAEWANGNRSGVLCTLEGVSASLAGRSVRPSNEEIQ
jgi:hypothetical protein